jgi:hypothetical protein
MMIAAANNLRALFDFVAIFWCPIYPMFSAATHSVRAGRSMAPATVVVSLLAPISLVLISVGLLGPTISG